MRIYPNRWRHAGLVVLGLGAFGVAPAQLLAPPSKAQAAPAQKLPMVVPAAPKASLAAPSFEPAWPLRFELLAGERESSAFAVTQAGAVRVELQAQGAPLVLSLRRPDGRVIERQGSGQIVIDDAASAADMAKGVLWGVGIRAAQESPAAPAAVGGARAMPRAVAVGTLSVRHPPADAARVSAALKAADALVQGKAAVTPQKSAAPDVDAKTQARLAQTAHDKQVAAGHAALLNKMQASVPQAAFAQMNRRIGLRLQGQSLQQASAAAPVQPISANTNAPLRLAAPGAMPAQGSKGALLGAKGATGSSQAAATGGAAAVGSGGGAAVAAPATPPALTSTSTVEGDPGTPLTLSGSDFGDAPGEVHVIVGGGKDVVAPITYWSGAQIVTEVPYADGIPAYDGHVYVKRADGTKSALRPFRFLPLYDIAEISQSSRDWFLAPSIVNIDSERSAVTGHPTHTGGILWGFTGNDKFYLNSQLRNGWVVSDARLAGVYSMRPGYSGAYLVDARPGTTSPYVEVRWWVDAAIGLGGSNDMSYSIRVQVKRPKSLPCSANPCPVL